MLTVQKSHNEQVVASINLFLDSSQITTPGSTGTDCGFELGGSTIICGPGQSLRLNLVQFNMYTNFYPVNSSNQVMTLTTTGLTPTSKIFTNSKINIKSQFYGSPRAVTYEAMVALSEFLVDKNFYSGTLNAGASLEIEAQVKEPTIFSAGQTGIAADKHLFTYSGTSERVCTGLLTWKNGAVHGLSAADIAANKFVLECKDRASELLGCDSFSISVDSTTTLSFSGKFPGQRSTDPYVYVRSSLASSNLESACAQTASSNSKNVISSDILAKIPISQEFSQYFAGADNVFFANLQTKNLSRIDLRLTNSRNEELPAIKGQTENTGNLSFQCILRVDVLQSTNPNVKDFTPKGTPGNTSQANIGSQTGFADGVASFPQLRPF